MKYTNLRQQTVMLKLITLNAKNITETQKLVTLQKCFGKKKKKEQAFHSFLTRVPRLNGGEFNLGYGWKLSLTKERAEVGVC